MAKNKTIETEMSVEDFLNAIKDDNKRKDCFSLAQQLQTQTGYAPKMWGSSIVGFGSYHYKYESGREGDSPIIAFSPRVSSIALYVSGDFDNRDELLAKLGKHKTDKGCVHIKTLSDIDANVLQQIMKNYIKYISSLHL
jgi:Domain of unknown function (DU1801)